MSEEYNDAHAVGFRAGIEAAIAIMQNCFDQSQESRIAVDPMELAIERLNDEIATSEPDRPVSVGSMPESEDA